MKSYLDLEIYQLAFHLATKEHKHSNTRPKIAQYELGSQVRKPDELFEDYQKRGKRLNSFIAFVEKSWNTKPITDNR